MVPSAIRRLIERFYPELKQRHHVPQLARIENVHDIPASDPEVSTWFRAHRAVDIQMLDMYGKATNAPLYQQVPLALGINAHDSGLVLEPRPGMQCLIQFIDGNNAMPVITHVLPLGQLVTDHKIDEVGLDQNNRASLRGRHGNWKLKSDGEISQHSQTSTVNAQTRVEQYHTKQTTIAAHDTSHIDGNQVKEIMGALKTVVGEKALLIALDNLLLGSKKQVDIKAHENMNLETLKTLHAKAANLAKLEGQTVWVGDSSVNVLQVLLDLIALVKDMNQTLATHTHSGAGTSPEAADFTGYKSTATNLDSQLSPITE